MGEAYSSIPNLLPFLFFFFSFFLFSLSSSAQKINVGLFFETPVRSATFTVQSGSYAVIVNDTVLIAALERGQTMQLTLLGGKLRVRLDGETDFYSSVKAVGMGDEGTFSLACTNPRLPSRSYAQHAFFSVLKDGSGLLLQNQVDEPLYIRGVVEAETGCTSKPEFFKVQSILCRTYLYAHINRHGEDGFNLCDGVHCQVYHGLQTRCKRIRTAVGETAGTIIIDYEKNPITTSFHANCGGQTCSSGEVWREQLPYLVSVRDEHCAHQHGSRWQRRIPLSDWRAYMAQNGIRVRSSKSFNRRQPKREKYYRVGARQLEYTKIRMRFGLRSAFFDVRVSGGEVLLTGRGYGHGVGMCQEGAMRMAEKGFLCEDIVQHYYKCTNLVTFNPDNTNPELQRDSTLYFFNLLQKDEPPVYIDDTVVEE
jgi:stage II sporulation protein D